MHLTACSYLPCNTTYQLHVVLPSSFIVISRCILCKGTPYPPVQPRPVMISVPLKIPVCEVATERGQLEEEFIRSVSLAPSEHTMLAKTLTKMFAVSTIIG